MKKIYTLFLAILLMSSLSTLGYAGEILSDKTETIEVTTDNWDQIVEYVNGLDIESLEGSITLTYTDTEIQKTEETETVELTVDNWNQFFEIEEDFQLKPDEFGILSFKYDSAGRVRFVLKDGILGVDENSLGEISFLVDSTYSLYKIQDYNEDTKEITKGAWISDYSEGGPSDNLTMTAQNSILKCFFAEYERKPTYVINPSVDEVINKDNIYYVVPQLTVKNVKGSLTYDKNSVIEIPPIIYTDLETIKTVQEALNQAGFDCGTPDGSAGPATLEALNTYQEANGLPVTTDITSELLEQMGIEK